MDEVGLLQHNSAEKLNNAVLSVQFVHPFWATRHTFGLGSSSLQLQDAHYGAHSKSAADLAEV